MSLASYLAAPPRVSLLSTERAMPDRGLSLLLELAGQTARSDVSELPSRAQNVPM